MMLVPRAVKKDQLHLFFALRIEADWYSTIWMGRMPSREIMQLSKRTGGLGERGVAAIAAGARLI